MRTRAGRTGPRSSSATPVLAEAGTAVAARAGGAGPAGAWADSRGRGIRGTPACAARPRCELVSSSMVRMAAAPQQNAATGYRGSRAPRPRPRPPVGAGRAPLVLTTYHPSGCCEPGLELIRRVAGRYMADVAKN